jgi:hypothetical protein
MVVGVAITLKAPLNANVEQIVQKGQNQVIKFKKLQYNTEF